MSKHKPKLKLKVIMLGKTMVGKTSITCRLAYGHCDEQTYATVGATFVMANRGNVKYDIWDTGGQERFRCLMPMYIRDSRIIIFVFDVTDVATLDILNNYISELGVLNNYYIIIVGNKMDLLDDEELKSAVNMIKEKLELLALKEKLHDCVLVSAKTGENFDNFLQKLHSCAKTCKHNDKEIICSSTKLEKVTHHNIQDEQSIKLEENNSQCGC
jgi:Ras-related protein Rab-6A